jgi:Carbohydrate family 9 binding domain-like
MGEARKSRLSHGGNLLGSHTLSGAAAGVLMLFAGNGAEAAGAGGGLLRPALDVAPPSPPVTLAAETMAQTMERAMPLASPFPPRDFNTYDPKGRATRIDPGEAPMIDGDPAEAVWQKAEAIEEFYQVDPRPGQPASERTVARFIYDSNTLYVSIYAYDREPDRIVASLRARDANLDVDDGVRIYIDPQLSRRDAYYFEMNSLGSRVDALIQNNNTFLPRWNTIWQGRAKRQVDGYSVEMAIPFRDLSFNPANPNWGMEIQRRIRRTGERIRWSNIRPAVYYADVSRSGTIEGISGANQGLGLDIQLYGKMNYKREWPIDHEASNLVFSSNAYYKITGTLTINPDFSDSPLDLRQVNTTRFNLFQPETRDFFLQDAAMFEFGGRSYVTRDGIARDNGRPFFSRNIGLAGNQPVSITTGGKLSGQVGGFSIGAVGVLTDGPLKQGQTCDPLRSITLKCGEALSVVRVTRPVLGESRLGMIFTNGDPTGQSANTVAGADFQYLNSNIVPGKVGQIDLFYARSMSSTKGNDDTWGASFNFPNEPYGGAFHVKQIGTNYAPAMGFASRTGIRQWDGILLRRDRNTRFRFFDVLTSWNVITGLDNHIQFRENAIGGGITTQFTDEYHIRAVNSFEDVPVPFMLAGKVPIPVGRYNWTNGNFFIRTSDGRPWAARFDVTCCHYYNGSYWRMDFQLDWRPIPLLQFEPRYTYTFFNLPTGSIGIHLATANVILNFTPDMQLFTQLQFDNVSQNFAASVRYRWEYQPGSELFVLLGQAAAIPGVTFQPLITQAAMRIGHTLRF